MATVYEPGGQGISDFGVTTEFRNAYARRCQPRQRAWRLGYSDQLCLCNHRQLFQKDSRVDCSRAQSGCMYRSRSLDNMPLDLDPQET